MLGFNDKQSNGECAVEMNELDWHGASVALCKVFAGKSTSLILHMCMNEATITCSLCMQETEGM